MTETAEMKTTVRSREPQSEKLKQLYDARTSASMVTGRAECCRGSRRPDHGSGLHPDPDPSWSVWGLEASIASIAKKQALPSVLFSAMLRCGVSNTALVLVWLD